MSPQPFNASSSGGDQKPQIGSRDLSILVDQMNHEALAYKKCTVYSQYFMDSSLKDIATAAAQHHKQHFDALENYLSTHR